MFDLLKIRIPFRDDFLFGITYLLLFFVPLVFFYYFADSYETVKLSFLLVFTAIAGLIIARRRPLQLKYSPLVLWSALAFAFWSVISTLFSLDVVNSIFGLHGRYTSSVLFYLVWVGLMVIFWTAGDQQRFRAWANNLVFISMLISIFALLQDAGFAFYVSNTQNAILRVPSFLGNANFSSMFIVSILPFALYFFWQAQRWAKAYYGFAAITIIWATMIFSSRGSMAAMLVELVVMLGLLLWLRFPKKALLTLLGSILISGLFLLAFYNAYRPGSLRTTIALQETSVESRFIVWDAATELIAENPWVGLGPGNFFIGLQNTGMSFFATSERFDDTHNLFLNIGAVGGLPLLIFFLIAITASAWLGWGELRRTKNPMLIAALAGLCGFMISASFNPVVVSHWLLLAFLVALLTLHQRKTWQPQSKPILVKLGITLASGLVIIYSVGLFVGHGLMTAAERRYRLQNYSGAEQASRWALRFNPLDDRAMVFLVGSLIQQSKSYDEAEKYIRRITALHPNVSGGSLTAQKLYFMLYQKNQNPEYLSQMDKAIEQGLQQEPAFAGQFNQIAHLYYKAGRFEESLSAIKKSLTLNNKQMYLWLMSAQIYQQQGQREQALYAIEKARGIATDLPLLKQVYDEAKAEPDVKKWVIPLAVPDPNI